MGLYAAYGSTMDPAQMLAAPPRLPHAPPRRDIAALVRGLRARGPLHGV